VIAHHLRSSTSSHRMNAAGNYKGDEESSFPHHLQEDSKFGTLVPGGSEHYSPISTCSWQPKSRYTTTPTHYMAAVADAHHSQWSTSLAGSFRPREKAIGSRCVEDCSASRANLDAVEFKKVPWPYWESIPSRPNSLLVLSPFRFLLCVASFYLHQ
jgi:hypothetical protein